MGVPVFDAVGPSAAGSASTTSPWTWNHTVTGTNTLLLVAFTNGNGSTPSSVTYGAQAMTLVTSIASGATASQVWLYKLVGATPGTAAVTVTVATPGQLTGGSVSFSSADQATGIGTAFTSTGNGASATVAVTSNSGGNLIFGFVGSGAADTSTSAPGTQRFQNNPSSSWHAGNVSGQTAPATGSTVTLTEVITLDDWGFIAVEVLPFGGGQFEIMPQQRAYLPVRRKHMAQTLIFNAQSPDVSILVGTIAAATAVPQVTIPAQFPYITQILGTGTAQYWADQNGNPIMFKADTMWPLAYNAGNAGGATTYQTDITNYCSIRQSQGFNAFLIACVGYTGIGAINDDGRTWDGVHPFTSPGVLNNSFWVRVDAVVQTAAGYGLTVILNPMFEYALNVATGALNGWSTANFTSYGTALGNRYKNAPNVLWEFGDDYGDDHGAAFDACLAAIRATGDTHLISVENLSPSTSRFSVADNSVFAWGTANAQFSWVYGYHPSYNSVEYAYKETSPLLVTKMDGTYDNGGNADPRIFWRAWAWWALSSGSRGFMYGRNDLAVQNGWPTNALTLLTNNTPDNSDFAKFWTIFGNLPGWHQLVPDTSSALVTAGRGTRFSDSVTTQYVSGNTYVTASKTADGTLAVIYNPAADTQTITVNGALMAAGYTATWVDPTSGAQASAGISTTYTRSAANSTGDHDWLLVLQAGAGAGTPPVIAPGAATTQAANW